jgi:hypothetical protein
VVRGARRKGDVQFPLKAGAAAVIPLTRSLLAATAVATLAAFTAGCGGASATLVGAGLSSTAPPASAPSASAPSASAPSASAPAASASSASEPAGAATAAPSRPAAVSAAPAPAGVVYLAEGGSVGGTVVHAPACATGCPLSGDGTTSLWHMTWATWDSAVAVGKGTEELDDCTPNCAAGTLVPVPVTVTLSKPVMVCVAGAGKWFWTRVSFTWPNGLPSAFSGAGAPLNPFDYPGITSQAARSCP